MVFRTTFLINQMQINITFVRSLLCEEHKTEGGKIKPFFQKCTTSYHKLIKRNVNKSQQQQHL